MKKRRRQHYLNPLSISLGYVVFASLWVLTSDMVVFNIIDEVFSVEILQHVKGLLFVLVTGGLLYVVMNRYRETLQEQSREISSLNREVHHRVKNNMTLIVSLLELERDSRKFNRTYHRFLEHTIYKIRTIALIHEWLYKQNTFSDINLEDFLKEFKDTIISQLNDAGNLTIKLKIDEKDSSVDIAVAMPIALLLYECVVNARNNLSDIVKQIHLNLYKTTDNLYLSCHYKCEGNPPMFNIEKSDKVELQIADVLLKQLSAYARVERDNSEVVIYADIPLAY